MRNCIIFSLLVFIVFLFSCAEAYPPEEEDEYVPTIIYRVSSATHFECPVIRYRDENGDLIKLVDEALPWEHQMVVDDNARLTLHAKHLQIPELSGNGTFGTNNFLLVDSSAPFDISIIDNSQTVLHVATGILHQISIRQSDTTLKLNMDTFEGGDAYRIYDRMHYTMAIYRIDETGREDPLVYSSQLYHRMNTTIETYAYK